MIADSLTKLAAAPVITVLHEAMNGTLPTMSEKGGVANGKDGGTHLGEATASDQLHLQTFNIHSTSLGMSVNRVPEASTNFKSPDSQTTMASDGSPWAPLGFYGP